MFFTTSLPTVDLKLSKASLIEIDSGKLTLNTCFENLIFLYLLSFNSEPFLIESLNNSIIASIDSKGLLAKSYRING